mgnify:CR=1 FL=1
MKEELKNEIFLYLDDLRESGAVNMFGATPYIVSLFDLSEKDARSVLSDWMAINA